MKHIPTEEEIDFTHDNAREILEAIFESVSPYDVYLLRCLTDDRKIKEGYATKKPEKSKHKQSI